MLPATPTCRTRVTAIRTTSSPRPGKRFVTMRRTILGGLKPKQIIAIGESQSAGRLVTYIDAVHPLVHVYDGFLVHSRGGGAPIRDDVGVPVLVFQTETDVSFSNLTARQPDTSTYRLWEVAGTAHYDYYGLSDRTRRHRRRAGCRRGARVDAEPHQPAERELHLQLPDQHRAGSLRPRRGLLPAQPVGDQGRRAAGRTSPPDHRGESRRLRHRCQRQRARRHPHPRRGCTRRDAERSSRREAPRSASSSARRCRSHPPSWQRSTPTTRTFVSAWVRATKSARAAGFLVDADAKELDAAAVRSDIGK